MSPSVIALWLLVIAGFLFAADRISKWIGEWERLARLARETRKDMEDMQ